MVAKDFLYLTKARVAAMYAYRAFPGDILVRMPLRTRDTNLCRSRRGEVDDGVAVVSRLAFVILSV